jgi:hypothetical protein
MSVGIFVWACTRLLTIYVDPSYVITVPGLISTIIALSMPLVALWRYPLHDRSTRLLILSTWATEVSLLLFLLLDAFGTDWTMAIAYVVSALGGVAAVALAAGLAGRSGSVRRPPLWLAALAVGAAFCVATTNLFLNGLGWTPLPSYLLNGIGGSLTNLVTQVAWLSIAWVGWSASRRDRGSWAWKLVFAAGALHVLAGLPTYLIHTYSYIVPTQVGASSDITTVAGGTMYLSLDMWWSMVAGATAAGALLLALLGGLQPSEHRDDGEPERPASDATPAAASDPSGTGSTRFLLDRMPRLTRGAGLAMAVIIAAALFGIATGQLPWGS